MGMAGVDGIHYGVVDVHRIRNMTPIVQLGTRATLTPWQSYASDQALQDGPVFVNNIHAWLTGLQTLIDSDPVDDPRESDGSDQEGSDHPDIELSDSD